MKSRTHPCPHNRLLTDKELDRICSTGWAQWKREQERERRNGDGPDIYGDPDWWKK